MPDVPEELCACGKSMIEWCARCGQPACGQHYLFGVWKAETPSASEGWVTQTPHGIYALDLDRGPTYIEGYAAGGPGCTTCRNRAAAEAVAEVSSQLSAFLTTGRLNHLEWVAEHPDELTDDQVHRLGRYLYESLGQFMEIVHVTFSLPAPPPPRKRWLPQSAATDAAIVTEVRRAPVAWLSIGRVALTAEGDILGGSTTQIRSAADVVVPPGYIVSGRQLMLPNPADADPETTCFTVAHGIPVARPAMTGADTEVSHLLKTITSELGHRSLQG